jgi:hypothetical protein
MPALAAGSGATPRAKLNCLDETLDKRLQGLEIVLADQPQTIGRDATNSICLPYEKVSRNHARISLHDQDWVLEDLKSTNGVFVNDKPVTHAVLKSGDIISIGDIPFRYTLDQPPPPRSSPVERTMYAGEPGVYAGLLSLKEQQAEERERPPPRRQPKRERELDDEMPHKADRSRLLPRLAVGAAIALALAGGSYGYYRHVQAEQVQAKIRTHEASLKRFIDNYEHEGAFDLAQLQALAAPVDADARLHPGSLGLKELQAKLIFLQFEREFFNLLNTWHLNEAYALILSTEMRIAPLLQGEANAIQQVKGLLQLARIVVDFKAFKQRFPNPLNPATLAPGPQDMLVMQQRKEELAQKKREHNEALTVTYTLFQRLVTDVDENDTRLVNRWKEVLRSKP